MLARAASFVKINLEREVVEVHLRKAHTYAVSANGSRDKLCTSNVGQGDESREYISVHVTCYFLITSSVLVVSERN